MASGTKICPECQTGTGPRSFKCPNPECQHVFIKKKVIKKSKKTKKLDHSIKSNSQKTYSSTSQGRKRCDVCKTIVGVRTKICVCGARFLFKPSFLKETRNAVDWQSLKRGDEIRVLAGSGPSYPVTRDNDTIELVNIGYYGKFRVHFVDDDGVHAYNIGKQESGRCHIYMGCSKTLKSGTLLEPHKIMMLKKKG